MISTNYLDFDGNTQGDGFVILGIGWVAGTTVLKKAQVYETVGTNGSGGETAIKAINSVKDDNAIYNLAGQKVSASYKGIVIKNGKKMIKK